MDAIVLMLGWAGLFAPLALGAIGSMVGCSRAGQAAAGALLETESGHGRYIGASAMLENAPALFALGALTGIALMVSAFAQGSACASAISVSKSKTEIFGIALAPAAVVEGFAVFVFVFALVLAGGVPGA